MKTKMAVTLLAVLGAIALAASAQDNTPPTGTPPMDGQENGGGMKQHRPPMPAIIKALDANHDGVMDADEIANASGVLKSLDKNGDGKLTPDEFAGPRPSRPGGQNRGQGNGPGDDGKMPPSGEGDGNNPPSGPPPGE